MYVSPCSITEFSVFILVIYMLGHMLATVTIKLKVPQI